MRSELSLYDFGKQLLDAGDLDPVYTLVWNARLEPSKLREWLLAYWSFYHVGTASWIVDQPSYWKAMETAAGSKDWPRSSERRHFRGENARKSVAYLKSRGVADLFRPLEQSRTADECIRRVREWVGFGPWIAFKVADMVERLDIAPVRFDLAQLRLFDSPAKGAELAWERYGAGEKPKDVTPWAVDSILSHLGRRLTSAGRESGYLAPPRFERALNAQEAETILCKWKSYLGGHYHVGEDVAACRAGLLRFCKSRTSQRLIRAGKEGGLW